MPEELPRSPLALSLRQMAEILDRAVRDGATERDAIESLDQYERARVAASLGFGESGVQLALQDVARALVGYEAEEKVIQEQLRIRLDKANNLEEKRLAEEQRANDIEAQRVADLSEQSRLQDQRSNRIWEALRAVGSSLQTPLGTILIALSTLVSGWLLHQCGLDPEMIAEAQQALPELVAPEASQE